MKVKVEVRFKEGVLDPEGQTILNTLNRKGYDFVDDVRVGKVIELEIEDGIERYEEKIEEICHSILANPIIEDYRIIY
ncbi:MAG: phosphoribosylformylglycinamidine synthase subunit PurS [Flexistipes sinusarabici]|uniref:Phosphoribosylformylglycinamidine synthase subunit PurS n=1 Tax=Flexistipes sinusarabici TaxID=2352 RepID=A0A5D0MLY3_FLESI|nr:phosphoribosylformylglycinamidine synthase subunit PurS [Flexistipes sinusarabici]TYB32450.1 MAG: phosphoribosylformylglycinamidine synthase subunit PurS [Flexistipes sinusarabici]